MQALDHLGWNPPKINETAATKPVLEEQDEVSNKRPPLAWGAKVSPVFRDRVWWIADELTKLQGGVVFDANYLMACMAFESGESFSASKKNPASSATGLIQFMSATAVDLGTTTARLAAMKDEDQLSFVFKYFEKMIKSRGPIRSLDDCYMAILWPKAIGKTSEYQLWVKGTGAYSVNAGLDKNKDHVVTKAEAASKVMEKLVKGLQPQYAA